MKTAELTGAALDWAVAICQNVECDEDNEPIWFEHDGAYAPRCPYKPSTDWAQGGPIIEREEIDIACVEGPEESKWEAISLTRNKRSVHVVKGPTPLSAAMRCYAASKLGDEVDVPEELK